MTQSTVELCYKQGNSTEYSKFLSSLFTEVAGCYKAILQPTDSEIGDSKATKLDEW